MRTAEIACGAQAPSSEIRKKILVRLRILVEHNPDIPLRILAGRAGTIGDVSADAVIAWAKADAPAVVEARRGPSDDEILDAVLRYERLVRERPDDFRYALAGEAAEPLGMTSGWLLERVRRLGGLDLPPSPHNERKAWSGGVSRKAAERYLALIEEHPDEPPKAHAITAGEAFGVTVSSVQAAARRLLADRNGYRRTDSKAENAARDRGLLTGAAK